MYPIRRGFCAGELCAEAQNDSPLRRMSGGGPGGCNGKNQKERMDAPPPQQGLAGGQQRNADHLHQLPAGHRGGDAAADPAHFQQDGAAGGHRRDVHRHQCHLCDRSDRAGYMEPVFAVWAGSHPDAHSGGRPWPRHPDQLFCAGSPAADGLPRPAAAGRERLGRWPVQGYRGAEDRHQAGSGLRGRGHRAAALRLRAPVRRRGRVGQRVHGYFGLLQCRL